MPAFINKKVGSDFLAILQRKLDICSGQYSSVFGKKPKSFITKQIQLLSTAFNPQYFSLLSQSLYLKQDKMPKIQA